MNSVDNFTSKTSIELLAELEALYCVMGTTSNKEKSLNAFTKISSLRTELIKRLSN